MVPMKQCLPDTTGHTHTHELTGNVHAQGLHKFKRDEIPVLREVSGHEIL